MDHLKNILVGALGYSWGIHGIYVCIGYVSGMYRVCIGNVSKEMGCVGGGVPTTDEHGNTIYISLVQCRSVEFSGQSITTEGCFSVGDIPTTDEHGFARKNEIQKHGDTEKRRI